MAKTTKAKENNTFPFQIDRAVEVDVTDLMPNQWNPNKMDDRTQEAVKESINAFGQVQELIVRPHPELAGKYEILDGEHRFNTLTGKAYVNVIHGLSDAEAKKITVVMDSTRGDLDKIDLAKLLAEIKFDLGDDLILGLPYSDSELDELIKLSSVDWDNFGETSDEFTPTEKEGDGLTLLHAKLPADLMDTLNQAADLIRDENTLNSNKDIAWGEIIGILAQAYLA